MFSSKNRLVFLLIIFFLFANGRIAWGCDMLSPTASVDPTVLIKCVLGELGISEETITDTTGSLDVARFKKPQPQVTITFTPNDPIPGEKVTASAQPMYFGNQPESLYYTWYLQPEICQGTTLSAEDKALCDLNKDGDVDIEDFKIKAMRIYANNDFEWDLSGAYAKHTDDDGYNAIKGGDDQQGKNNFCYFQNTKDGTQTALPCFHFFPDAKGYTTGDGTFNIKEEEFWHTDPNNPDTAATGHPDEANVTGLGAKDFSWTYQAGDQVGIVIEGVSVDSTTAKDSSFKIMWAFLNGTCSKDHPVPATEREFNDECLLKNMLAPTEGGGKNEKIEMSLSFSPTNPVNDTVHEGDSAGDNADWINVVSTIENYTKTESLHYIWNVYAGQSADTDGTWTSLLKSQLAPLGIEQTVGAGIPNLKFKANFGDDTPNGTSTTAVPRYLKIKLNVSEKVTSGTGSDTEKGTRKGHAEAIIPLSSFNNNLSAFNTIVDNSLNLAIKKKPTDPSTDDEICKIPAGTDETLVSAAICQVAPDEILAVKADIVRAAGETWDDYDFLWTLNDQSLSYKYDPLHSNADFKPNNMIYFPVLAPKGSTLNLNLVATNRKTGNKISLNKTFLVSEPTFKIISTDEAKAKPKLLGKYIDLDGKEWPDYSQTEFLALANSNINLALAPFASFPLPDAEDLPIKWYWNEAQLAATERSLSFSATQETGTSFSLKAEGLYTQDINTKKALRNYWGVSLDEYYEQRLSQKIDFTLMDTIDESDSDSAQKGRGKILASFISSVPSYFAFLFRLVMTAFVLLAAIWILFALFPQTEKND